MIRTVARAALDRLPAKRALFALIRPLKPPHRIYQHLHFTGPFTTYLGFRMHADGGAVENELYWGGKWEQASLRLWQDAAKRSTGILDVGAYVGVYALAAKHANPAARVTAFEPVHRNAERVRANVALNGYDIAVEEVAVSDQSGTTTLHDTSDSLNCSASLEDAFDFNTVRYSVPTISIDDYLEARGWPTVDLLKIDVEAHEPAVFRGMVKTIERFRPTIFVEVLSAEAGKRLSLPGYDCFAINETSGPVAVPFPQPLGGRNWNNLLVPQC